MYFISLETVCLLTPIIISEYHIYVENTRANRDSSREDAGDAQERRAEGAVQVICTDEHGRTGGAQRGIATTK